MNTGENIADSEAAEEGWADGAETLWVEPQAEYRAKMSGNGMKTVKALLRTEVLPALRAYGVADVEAAYEVINGRVNLCGTQFRDGMANRVSRLTLPAILLQRMEDCLLAITLELRLVDGEGVLAVPLALDEVVLRHAPSKEGSVPVQLVSPL